MEKKVVIRFGQGDYNSDRQIERYAMDPSARWHFTEVNDPTDFAALEEAIISAAALGFIEAEVLWENELELPDLDAALKEEFHGIIDTNQIKSFSRIVEALPKNSGRGKNSTATYIIPQADGSYLFYLPTETGWSGIEQNVRNVLNQLIANIIKPLKLQPTKITNGTRATYTATAQQLSASTSQGKTYKDFLIKIEEDLEKALNPPEGNNLASVNTIIMYPFLSQTVNTQQAILKYIEILGKDNMAAYLDDNNAWHNETIPRLMDLTTDNIMFIAYAKANQNKARYIVDPHQTITYFLNAQQTVVGNISNITDVRDFNLLARNLLTFHPQELTEQQVQTQTRTQMGTIPGTAPTANLPAVIPQQSTEVATIPQQTTALATIPQTAGKPQPFNWLTVYCTEDVMTEMSNTFPGCKIITLSGINVEGIFDEMGEKAFNLGVELQKQMTQDQTKIKIDNKAVQQYLKGRAEEAKCSFLLKILAQISQNSTQWSKQGLTGMQKKQNREKWMSDFKQAIGWNDDQEVIKDNLSKGGLGLFVDLYDMHKKHQKDKKENPQDAKDASKTLGSNQGVSSMQRLVSLPKFPEFWNCFDDATQFHTSSSSS